MKPSRDGFLTNDRQQQVYYQCWQSEVKSKANLFIVHGLGEHSGRYQRLIEALSPRGFQFTAIDLIGHGKSAGKRGHVAHFDDFLDDIGLALDTIDKPATNQLPLFLLGHSLGGLIGFYAALRFADRWQGVILSAPVFALAMPVPKLKAKMGKITAAILPSLTLKNELDPAGLSHDEQVVKAYIEDPLVHDQISTRLFVEMMSAMQAAPQRAKELQLPLLLIQGGADPIVSPTGTRTVYNAVASTDKSLLVYDGFYHESFNERDNAAVFNDLEHWLLQHLK